jgi:hypothetical protein
MSRYRVKGRERQLLGMQLDTRQRPSEHEMKVDRDRPNVLYFHSYLLTRTVIGAIGVLLPLVLMLIEGVFTTHGGCGPRIRSAPTITPRPVKMCLSAASALLL